MCKKLEQTRACLRAMFRENRFWAESAVVRIAEHQTTDEIATKTTKNQNNVGFGAFDAETGTDLAEAIVKHRQWNGAKSVAFPHGWQQAKVQKLALKHAGQLAKMMLAGG